MASCADKIRIPNSAVRLFVGELIGTCLATLVIDASVFQFVLDTKASDFGLSFAIGMSIAFGIYTCGMIAPFGPINPNVAVGLGIAGHVPLKMLPLYYLAELIGAFLGHLWGYGLYVDAIKDLGVRLYHGNPYNTTQTVFLCSFPKLHAGTATQMFEIFTGVFLLMFLILIILEVRNFNIPGPAQPLLVGIAVTVLTLSFAHNTGGPLNMALDLTGRAVSSMMGWGSLVWMADKHYFWIPIVMGQLGGIVASVFFCLVIRPNLPKPEENEGDLEMVVKKDPEHTNF